MLQFYIAPGCYAVMNILDTHLIYTGYKGTLVNRFTVTVWTACVVGRALYQTPGTLQAKHHVIETPSFSVDHLDGNRVKGATLILEDRAMYRQDAEPATGLHGYHWLLPCAGQPQPSVRPRGTALSESGNIKIASLLYGRNRRRVAGSALLFCKIPFRH